jgi:hypothetical protein
MLRDKKIAPVELEQLWVSGSLSPSDQCRTSRRTFEIYRAVMPLSTPHPRFFDLLPGDLSATDTVAATDRPVLLTKIAV